MPEFKQINYKTGEEHTVVVHADGIWHSWLPPTRGLKFHDSLASFQKYFGCSDEDLEIIKLKYGSPVLFKSRWPARPKSTGPQ